MKSKTNPEYENFTGALKKVLQVSHEEMKTKLDAEKQEKQRQKKQPSDRASGERD